MPVEEKTDQREADEKVVEIELERLRSFTNHPFKVQADSQMIELQDSIRNVYCTIKIPKVAEGNPKSCMRNFPIIADAFGISLRPQ